MNLFEAIVLTLIIYGLTKYVSYMVKKAYEQGFRTYEEEQQKEAEEVFRKIKEEL